MKYHARPGWQHRRELMIRGALETAGELAVILGGLGLAIFALALGGPK